MNVRMNKGMMEGKTCRIHKSCRIFWENVGEKKEVEMKNKKRGVKSEMMLKITDKKGI
jgi:hypothetical protein